jgi:hypothetical protein
MANTAELKVGTNVDIVFENELMKSDAHYMKALVYDCAGSKITTSQTSPALDRHFLGRRIIVTFLVKMERRILRYGFPAKLTDLISNYRIASNNNVDALVIEQLAKPKQVDFRMYFRVKTSLSSNISLAVKEGRVNLVDISLGGAKFTCPKHYLLRPADVIKINLSIGQTGFSLMARVCDAKTPYDSSEIKYVSIQFEHVNKQLEVLLGKAIIDMERQMLSEGKL